MNFSQRLGLFILVVVSLAYVYFSFFNKDAILPSKEPSMNEEEVYSPLTANEDTVVSEPKKTEKEVKTVKIFLLDKAGTIRSVNRTCDSSVESSCLAYAVKELVMSPSKWEKSKGLTSEIPQNTKILSIRESSGNVLVDLSSDFEAGGGAESIYMRVKQVIKTVNANTSSPVYLYINGKQANVIGGEGIMVKQPLNERSLDE
jgi:spore germination protein GerM